MPPALIALVALWSTPPVWAAPRSGGGASAHLISLGAGIAQPSDTSALLENPAGFTYNNGVKLLLTGTAEDTNTLPESVGAGLFLGNGTVAGALKYDWHDRVGSVLTAGIGVEIQAIRSSLGLACGASLGSSVSVSCSQFGLLYEGLGKARLGAKVNTTGTTAVGAGVAVDATNDIAIAVDGAFNTSGGGFGIKPGVLLKLAPAQLALGYGFVDSGGTNMIRSGFSVGFGLEADKSISIQAYYQQLAQYFLGVAIAF